MDRIVLFLFLSSILPATGLGRRNENRMCCSMIIKQRCYKKLCDRRRICDCDVMIPFDPIIFELTVVYRRFNLAMQYMYLTLFDSSRNMQVTS